MWHFNRLRVGRCWQRRAKTEALCENFQYFEDKIDYIHINFNSKNGIDHREVTSTTACYVQMDYFRVDLRDMEKVR